MSKTNGVLFCKCDENVNGVQNYLPCSIQQIFHVLKIVYKKIEFMLVCDTSFHGGVDMKVKTTSLPWLK